MNKPIIYTIGHSTRTLGSFISLLKKYKINEVVDIRTIPFSAYNPQFNMDTLAKILRNHQIGYNHMKALGGFRHSTMNSVNLGWHNRSFRGFADYMQTPDFNEAIQNLVQMIKKKTIVLMCAEILPWRCHRSLIADALLIQHIKVYNIYNSRSLKEHTLTSFACVKRNHIFYPLKS